MYVALNKAFSLMISVHIRDCMGSFDGIIRTKWRLFDKTYMKRFDEMTS